MSMPAVSNICAFYASAGLLTQTKQGRSRRCRLVAEPLAEAAHWMAKYERFWEDRFVALEQYLNASSQNEQSEQKENTQ